MKTVLVTGGTSGIGRAIAQRLHACGDRVLVVSSRKNADNLPPGVALLTADLSDPAAVRRLAIECRERFPDLSVVIHSAGVQYEDEWLTTPDGPARIAQEIAVNLTSPLQLTRELLPVLCQQPDAAVVFVTSALIYAAKRSAPVYCGTKAALHQTAMALRYQLAGTSVRMVELIPPLVDTPMTAGRGRGKMAPETLADRFLKDFDRGKTTIRVGKARLLYALYRLAPSLAARVMR